MHQIINSIMLEKSYFFVFKKEKNPKFGHSLEIVPHKERDKHRQSHSQFTQIISNKSLTFVSSVSPRSDFSRVSKIPLLYHNNFIETRMSLSSFSYYFFTLQIEKKVVITFFLFTFFRFISSLSSVYSLYTQ